MSGAIELQGVSKQFGSVRAVEDLSLTIPEGALFGLIGPNGAGKTTAFSMMSGFLRPSSGTIVVRGESLSASRAPIGKVLALPQDAQLPEHRRVLDVLTQLAWLGGWPQKEAKRRAEEALDWVGLSELSQRTVRALSHGQRRRVGIAATLLGENEVILLDEPSAGLDPRTAIGLQELIRDLHHKKDRTIVLSSHDLTEVETICSHAAILDKGHLVVTGTMDEIKGTGNRLRIRLAKPVSDPQGAERALAELPKVASVRYVAEELAFEIEPENTDDIDSVSNEVLKFLLEVGVVVSSVERGTSLRERFMATTGGAKD